LDLEKSINITPRWLEWAREIQALAQTGYHYAENHFQQERNQRLVEIAAEIVAEYSDLEYPIVEQTFLNQTGYATPRVDVRAAVFREGKLLLVRERKDGGWTMPGGWADVGDLPSEAAEREVWEEAGFKVKATRLIGVYDSNRFDPLDLFHAYKIVFMCEIISGEERTSSETSEVAFFEPDKVPLKLSGERTHQRHIWDAFHVLKNPDSIAVFD
jgi:ADP-ribose pyrophosphatase YjhB (NUDIX family)